MRSTIVAVSMSMLVGCADPPKADGGACAHAQDCASKDCEQFVCVGGHCSDSGECPDGFACHFNEGGAFSNGSYGCDMLCTNGTCPFPGFACGADNHCVNSGGSNAHQSLTSDPDDLEVPDGDDESPAR